MPPVQIIILFVLYAFVCFYSILWTKNAFPTAFFFSRRNRISDVFLLLLCIHRHSPSSNRRQRNLINGYNARDLLMHLMPWNAKIYWKENNNKIERKKKKKTSIEWYDDLNPTGLFGLNFKRGYWRHMFHWQSEQKRIPTYQNDSILFTS